MTRQYFLIYPTPVGNIRIEATDTHIISVHRTTEPFGGMETDLIKEAVRQLDEYFDGKRKHFNLPIDPKGTEFQKKVWEAVNKIPYGETQTYGDIARAVGNPKACRAVGGANNKNPITILIPCHRVVGASGELVGYDGGLEMKKYLLDLEKEIA